jgi:hypothetical protein
MTKQYSNKPHASGHTLLNTIYTCGWAPPVSKDECELQYSLGTLTRRIYDFSLFTNYYGNDPHMCYRWVHYCVSIYAESDFNFFEYTRERFKEWLTSTFPYALEVQAYRHDPTQCEYYKESFVIIPAPEDFKILYRSGPTQLS